MGLQYLVYIAMPSFGSDPDPSPRKKCPRCGSRITTERMAGDLDHGTKKCKSCNWSS